MRYSFYTGSIIFAIFICTLLVTNADAAVVVNNTTSGYTMMYRFNGTGNSNFTVPANVTTLYYIVVAGGGGGGGEAGAGGGAGGLLNGTLTVTPSQILNLTVGAGGIGGPDDGSLNNATNGLNSTFNDNIIAIGGGHGGNRPGGTPVNGTAGGSGGGAVLPLGLPGNGTAGQGYRGGYAVVTGANAAGGGGGAGGVGGNTTPAGGVGGAGKNFTIGSNTICLAGGGGGGQYTATNLGNNPGGCGGGFGAGLRSAAGGPATNGTGGGGGGANAEGATQVGGFGGSGTVILYYSLPPVTIINGANTVLVWNRTASNVFWTVPTGVTTVDYLVVAGGGGGGGFGGPGGGGGAGGLLNVTGFAVNGTITINIGNGGSGARGTYGGSSGSNSSFGNQTAVGGGGAAGWTTAALIGGSGGGGSGGGGANATGTSGQGTAGGIGYSPSPYMSGGGGGSGQKGFPYNGTVSGSGGNGTQFNLTGTLTWYGGGGGGASTQQGATRGLGGLGGGGDGANPYNTMAPNGTDGLGGGGGGSHTGVGGKGGVGTVIISYTTPIGIQSAFTADVTTGIAPVTVHFNDTTTGSPTGWNWSYRNVTGDNQTVWFSQTQHPVYTFGLGNYSIVLNASVFGGSNLSTQTTFINTTLGTASFIPSSPQTGLTPLSVAFNGTTTISSPTWNWSWGDGTANGTTQNIMHTFSAGNRSVTLTVGNIYGNYNAGQVWVNATTPVSNPTNITYDGGYTVLSYFNMSNSSLFVPPLHVSNISVLLVGGGGHGGESRAAEFYGVGNGGGGGGGGVIYNTSYTIPNGTNYVQLVIGGSDQNTTFSPVTGSGIVNPLTAIAGGAGGIGVNHRDEIHQSGGAGYDGASSGGGGSSFAYPGNYTVGQGFNGSRANQYWGGGGGGAGGNASGGTGGLYRVINDFGYNLNLAGGGDAAAGNMGYGATSQTIGGGGGGSSGGDAPLGGNWGAIIIKYRNVSECGASFVTLPEQYPPAASVEGWSPYNVSFQDTSWASPYPVVSWNWSYVGSGENTTSGTFSTQQNPSFKFITGKPGTPSQSIFAITLRVTNSNGDTYTSTCQNTSVIVDSPVTYAKDVIVNGSCRALIYNYTPFMNYVYVVPEPKEGLTAKLKYLVVAGGGAGGYSYQPEYQTAGYGGGGGAGGLLSNDNWGAAPLAVFNIYSGLAQNNSTIYNADYFNITSIRGGSGGYGVPDTQGGGEPGYWGGSGGGAGSGGDGTPWACQMYGGSGVLGQGYNGSPAWGGYALTMGGGGGGSGGLPPLNCTTGVGATSAPGPGTVSNITFANVTYAEGGWGTNAMTDVSTTCSAAAGSGGRAWWHPYYGDTCTHGNEGIIIIQECYHQEPLVVKNLAPPHIVQFHVVTDTGAQLPNAYVGIKGFTTTTGSWDWLQTLLRIPLDEAVIQTTVLSGTTDSSGTIEFLMIPTTKYNVTTSLAGYTFQTLYVVPHDSEYIITADSNQTVNGWIIPEPVVLGIKTLDVTKTNVNATLGKVNLFYNDTGLTTTGGFVNITSGKTLLYSVPVSSNTFNESRNITIPAGGISVLVSARIITTGDMYTRDVPIDFAGQKVVVPATTNPNLLMWISLGLILFTSMLTAYGAARHVSIVMCAEAWIFLTFGWLDPLVAKVGIFMVVGMFSLATILSVLWNLREGLRIENSGSDEE